MVKDGTDGTEDGVSAEAYVNEGLAVIARGLAKARADYAGANAGAMEDETEASLVSLSQFSKDYPESLLREGKLAEYTGWLDAFFELDAKGASAEYRRGYRLGAIVLASKTALIRYTDAKAQLAKALADAEDLLKRAEDWRRDAETEGAEDAR